MLDPRSVETATTRGGRAARAPPLPRGARRPLSARWRSPRATFGLINANGGWSTSPRATWPGRGRCSGPCRGRWTPRRSWPTSPPGRPLLGAGRRAAATAPAALARAVRRRPRRVGLRAGRDPRAPGGHRSGAGLRRLGPARLSRPGSATCLRTRRPTRTWAWRSRTWGGGPRRSARASAAWRSCRSAGRGAGGRRPARARPDLHPGW